MTPTVTTKSNETSISEFKYVRITYGAIVFVIGIIFGFSTWMTTISMRQAEQGAAIDILKTAMETLINVDKRLTRIETVLEDLKQQTKGNR